MVRVDNEMGREVYSLLLLVPGGLRFFSQRLSGEIERAFIKMEM
jgi:hypothetical protein